MMENMYAKDREAERLQREHNRLRPDTIPGLERTQPGDRQQRQDHSHPPLQSHPVPPHPIPQRRIRREQIVL